MKYQKLSEEESTGYSLLIYGAGGQGKVVLDSALFGGHRVLGFLDDDPDKWGMQLQGYPVFGGLSILEKNNFSQIRIVVAIGVNALRQKKVNCIKGEGYFFVPVVHPKTIVSPFSTIDEGTMVIAGAIINIETQVGKHVIVNTGSTIDHDCRIGDFVHVAPGVHIGGEVMVGEGTLVGIGAVVKPGVKIGSWSVIGAGAVVIEDLPDSVVAVGVPAKVIRKVEPNR
ncbi:MAG: acetyltransferase [Candidatus Atribacteria bacterium]|nr:acetyltransferase [Candidatus Atribacteria bacterium]